ncbi:MAG: translation elongation factor Ts [Dongiaceae bacterium]
MAAITAQMVKDLREKTGAGMMDCKAALTETGGDMEAAIDWLRAKSLSKAAKKADRVAAEGLIGVALEAKAGTVVEVNSETDFVARNDLFQSMVKEIATLALKAKGDTAKLAASKMPGGKAVTDHIQEMVGKIGENMSLRRTAYLKVADGVVASYVHNSVAPDLGKIGVLVALESKGDAGKLMELGRQICMHVAATNPLALTAEEIDPAVVERERAILTEQAREQGKGKPDAVIAKMVQGRLDKFFKESVLLKQVFVIDGENTVEQAIELAAKKIGSPVKVTGFVRYALGEGIAKAETDFAAEVAAAAAG